MEQSHFLHIMLGSLKEGIKARITSNIGVKTRHRLFKTGSIFTSKHLERIEAISLLYHRVALVLGTVKKGVCNPR